MIPFLKPILPSVERYQQSIYKMHENGWFSNDGPFIKQFEADLQRYLRTDRQIVGVNNATIGLMMALKSLNIRGCVLVPSFTFAATIGALEWCNLDYEYVDIDHSWNICPTQLQQKLSKNQYGAIIAVHTFGCPCDIRALESLACQHDVPLIFDAAPSIGALYHGQPVGNFGDAEIFSLHATKNLPIGEGGFIAFKDTIAADRAKQVQNFGFQQDRIAHTLGLNGKMPEIAAAIGIEALKDLDQHIRNRQHYVQRYKDQLDQLVEFQQVADSVTHSYQCLGILVPDGEQAQQAMERRGIQVRRYFSDPMHTQPAHRRNVVLPKTEDIAKKIINLPLYSVMDESTIDTVCSNLKDILNGST